MTCASEVTNIWGCIADAYTAYKAETQSSPNGDDDFANLAGRRLLLSGLWKDKLRVHRERVAPI